MPDMRAAAFALAAMIALPLPALAQEQAQEPSARGGVCLGTPEECEERRRNDQRVIDEGLGLVLNFVTDSAELTQRQKQQLSEFAAVLRNNRLRTVRFVVEGHTDSFGSDEHNRELSRRRAEAVVDFLVASGIDASRLEPLGKGMNWPLVEDPFHPVNRRVELRLRSR